MTKYWFSCDQFTIQVNCSPEGIIIWTAPIAQKFVGQPFDNLKNWKKLTGVRIEILK